MAGSHREASDPDPTAAFERPALSLLAERIERRGRIDRFTLLEPVGRGGEGVVFAAYDPRLDRRVALKVLPGSDGDGSGMQRRLGEARALARLSHPNVLSVYDAGVIDDAVYLVLEYVEGTSMAAHLREHDPPPKEVLALYRQAGAGLAAAHGAGVVHGDFKPTNVLVGSDGRVRVMDFGLARIAGSVEGAKGRFGTPAYMAPERLRGGPPTPEADQFAFCVALYEGLFGGRPFLWDDEDSLREAVEAGRVRPPPADSRVPRRVRRAVLRGLHADPRCRFPSMDALLSRLGWTPRRVGAFAALGVVLGAAGGVAGYGVHRSDVAEVCAARAARLDRVWSPDRVESLRTAWRKVDAGAAEPTLARVVPALSRYADEWQAAAQATCLAQSEDGMDGKALSHVRAYCLERNARAFEAFVDALVRGDEATIRRAVEGVVRLPPPGTCDTEAFAFDARAENDGAVASLRARIDQALGLQLAGDYDGGVEVAAEAVRAAERLGRPALAAEARLRLGMIEHYAGRYADAAGDLAEAAFAAEAAGADHSMALARTVLVHVLGRHLRDFDGARLWARHAQAAVDRAGLAEEDVQARLWLYQGMLARDMGDPAAARTHLLRARDLRVRLQGEDTAEVAEVDVELARLYEALGELGRAVDHARRALAVYESILGPGHPELAPKQHVLGRLLGRLGKAREAVELLRRARDGFAAMREEGYPDLGKVLADWGRLDARAGRFDRAEVRLTEAALRLEAAFGPDHPEAAAVRLDLAKLWLATGQVERARAAWERARRALIRTVPATHPDRRRAEAMGAEFDGGGVGASRSVVPSLGPGG